MARLLILFISIQFQVQYKVILYPRGSKEVHLFYLVNAYAHKGTLYMQAREWLR